MNSPDGTRVNFMPIEFVIWFVLFAAFGSVPLVAVGSPAVASVRLPTVAKLTKATMDAARNMGGISPLAIPSPEAALTYVAGA